MNKKNFKKLELILEILFFVVFGIVVLIACSSCVQIPKPLENGTRALHESNLIICPDYVRLVFLEYKGEELETKLELIRNHLLLSKALDDYVKGQGDNVQFLLFNRKEMKDGK